jgi:hypothetical protein
MYDDYFAATPIFHEGFFRRRYRIRMHVFLCIVEGVKGYDNYFTPKKDYTKVIIVFSPLQKCIVAVRMLAQGTVVDVVDEYVGMAESTCIEATVRFATVLVKVLGEEYLREPNDHDA